MTSEKPSAFACSAFAWLVIEEMLCLAPSARASWIVVQASIGAMPGSALAIARW